MARCRASTRDAAVEISPAAVDQPAVAEQPAAVDRPAVADRPAATVPSADSVVPDDAGDLLLPVAREAIARSLGMTTPGTETGVARAETFPSWVLEPGASFVTLTKGGRLRGCIGSPVAQRPLLDDVRANAVAAASRDPRFVPMEPAELPVVAIEVSVLSAPQPLPVGSLEECYAALRPGVDGVIVEMGDWNRALFLPQVWDEVPDPVQFLGHLWRKAGVAPGVWYEGTTVQTFTVRAWHEGPDGSEG
ncbi:AmmeMemoRadiSam system protein A [Cellulomonas sp. P24]|uniref:AmmeMemoRadiSam system protein A n=1 Tax=Cellulomonas sp. P24 TaxID=2885206 RepID=UPI00216AF61A|nr:AmmeMemoRadiSam system protein A [Cellulomonas sp. P24]MCR6493034.1 AmmeMemoRadiSam system protein A [Cellulomonas sp. P24]